MSLIAYLDEIVNPWYAWSFSTENINCRDSAGRNSTPLHLAAGYNNLEVSEYKRKVHARRSRFPM